MCWLSYTWQYGWTIVRLNGNGDPIETLFSTHEDLDRPAVMLPSSQLSPLPSNTVIEFELHVKVLHVATQAQVAFGLASIRVKVNNEATKSVQCRVTDPPTPLDSSALTVQHLQTTVEVSCSVIGGGFGLFYTLALLPEEMGAHNLLPGQKQVLRALHANEQIVVSRQRSGIMRAKIPEGEWVLVVYITDDTHITQSRLEVGTLTHSTSPDSGSDEPVYRERPSVKSHQMSLPLLLQTTF